MCVHTATRTCCEYELGWESVQGQLSEKQARVEELEEELEAVRSRAVSVMADMDNLRKRTTQQMEETRQFALQVRPDPTGISPPCSPTLFLLFCAGAR